MKMNLKRYSIQIVPENDEDIAYLEEIIGAKEEEAMITKRVDAFGLSSLAYIEISKIL
jgi:stalled ribosome rescue protein Dom34